jgi:hypothetical protein
MNVQVCSSTRSARARQRPIRCWLIPPKLPPALVVGQSICTYRRAVSRFALFTLSGASRLAAVMRSDDCLEVRRRVLEVLKTGGELAQGALGNACIESVLGDNGVGCVLATH